MTPEERQNWLAERPESIGASEGGAIIEINGQPLSEFGDSYQVYCAKVHGYEVPDNHAMACGRLDEAGIAYLFEQETGRLVADPGATTIQRSKNYPFISATLDRIQEDTQQYPGPDGFTGTGVLELKDVNPQYYPLWVDCEQQYRWDPMTRTRRLCWVPHTDPAAQWALSPPMHYQCQLQLQMYCTGLRWGTLCGKFPGRRIAWRDYPRNDRFLNWAIPQLVAFWDRVQRRDPPPIRRESMAEVVKAVFTEANGETVNIDEEIELAAFEWEAIKKEASKLDKRRKLLRAQVMAALGNANWADMPDGRFLKRMLNKKGYFDLKIVKRK